MIEPVSNVNPAVNESAKVEAGLPAGELLVLERPSLALNIRLIDEMQGTGLQVRQWLIQRDTQFIQVSELFYRVAEQANGQRTLEEIAERVTESTDWLVSPEHVRHLLQTKLIPLGLIDTVDTTDGRLGSPQIGNARNQGRSPLAVNLRMKVFGPRAIDPFTKVLQFLYAPIVLIPMLITIAIATGWLYLVHGVIESITSVVYTPSLALVMLPLVLTAAVFHEFGHASALRYGGGQVRAIGQASISFTQSFIPT